VASEDPSKKTFLDDITKVEKTAAKDMEEHRLRQQRKSPGPLNDAGKTLKSQKPKLQMHVDKTGSPEVASSRSSLRSSGTAGRSNPTASDDPGNCQEAMA
jgi:hypothetical protein